MRIIWLDPTGKQSLVAGAYLKLKARWLQISGLMTILALVGLWFLLALPLSFRGIQLDWLGKSMLGISILTLPHTVVVCLGVRPSLSLSRLGASESVLARFSLCLSMIMYVIPSLHGLPEIIALPKPPYTEVHHTVSTRYAPVPSAILSAVLGYTRYHA